MVHLKQRNISAAKARNELSAGCTSILTTVKRLCKVSIKMVDFTRTLRLIIQTVTCMQRTINTGGTRIKFFTVVGREQEKLHYLHVHISH